MRKVKVSCYDRERGWVRKVKVSCYDRERGWVRKVKVSCYDRERGWVRKVKVSCYDICTKALLSDSETITERGAGAVVICKIFL